MDLKMQARKNAKAKMQASKISCPKRTFRRVRELGELRELESWSTRMYNHIWQCVRTASQMQKKVS